MESDRRHGATGVVAFTYGQAAISDLPGPLEAIARCLPQTFAIDIARRSLLPDFDQEPLYRLGTFSTAQTDLVTIAAFACVLPVFGAWMFRSGLNRARFDGGLSRWA